jgi:hypothetical protein
MGKLSSETFRHGEIKMIKSIAATVLAVAIALAASSMAPAPASAQTTAACDAKAVSKTGKPLSGAAKTASVTKCLKDYCEANAVSSTGKKLSGAARTSFLKKCEQG